VTSSIPIDVFEFSTLIPYTPEENTDDLFIGERQIRIGAKALTVDPQVFAILPANELITDIPHPRRKRLVETAG
jgi:hypothetical protein